MKECHFVEDVCVECGFRRAISNLQRICVSTTPPVVAPMEVPPPAASEFVRPNIEEGRENATLEDFLATKSPYLFRCGTELHALLRDWLGIEPTPDCPCRSMASKMDRLGPDWCESDEGMTEILGVMRTEHEKRRAEGTTILPWTDFGARQLVLLACRRARAKAAG